MRPPEKRTADAGASADRGGALQKSPDNATVRPDVQVIRRGPPRRGPQQATVPQPPAGWAAADDLDAALRKWGPA